MKWLVGLAVVLVAAVILGVGAVLATSIFSGRSEAGAPCPEKVGRYLRRFAGATMQPDVMWSGCKISSGLVLRASFDLDAPGKTVLRSTLKRRGFQPVTAGDIAQGWLRQAKDQRTVIFEYPNRSDGQFTILHAEAGVR